MSVKQKIQDLKKDHIIGIATKHFMEEGYENTKMNLVAKEAGVSIGTIYDFFENKEGVFKAALFSKIENSHKEFKKTVDNIKDPKEKLVKFIEFKFNQISMHKDTITELFQATPWFFSKIVLTDPFIEMEKTLVRYFKELSEKEPLKEKDFQQVAMNFIYYTEGYCITSIRNGADVKKDPKEVVDEFLYGAIK